MPIKFTGIIALAVTALFLSGPAPAQSAGPTTAADPAKAGAPAQKSKLQQAAELEQQSKDALEAENWVRFYVANGKLHELRPYERDYLVNIVRACGQLGRASTAYHFMLKMQQQGMAYDFNTTDDTLKIRNTEAYDYINGLLTDANRTAGEGNVAFRSDGDPANFRAMAWDPSRDRLLVGSVRQGSVIALDSDGGAEVLLRADETNGLWSIGGLAVDADNGRLWISSSAVPEFAGLEKEDFNQAALFELDLASLRVLARYPLSDDRLKHRLGSVAVTRDGHVYVINRDAPIIYRKTPDSDSLDVFFASPELMALSDIAATPDNSRVFVSDTWAGITVIDPVAQQATLMGGPETMNLGRIEGMRHRDGKLYVVQGGFEPQRVVRLELDDSGTVVQSVSPMAIALEEFDRPAGASLTDGEIYYFANQGAEGAAEVIVMSTPLDAGVAVAPPDLEALEQAVRAKQQSGGQ